MKQTRLLSALLAFSAVPFLASAQPVVSNVNFTQQPDGEGSTQVVVNYDLVSDDAPSTVSLLYSLDAALFEFATAVSGDVGGGMVTGTNKELVWAVAQDLPSTETTSLVVRVLAEDGQPIGLSLSATVADSTTTNQPNQTVTYDFDEPVAGFSANDVTVTNATKGPFSGSGSVYTLEITALADGTVSITVPAGAAVSASGSGNTTLAAGPYEFDVDTTPPTIASTDPADEAAITSLSEIVVTFTEEVINLTAGQLTVNGSPADTITGTNPYTFSGFDSPALGTVNVVLAAGSTTDVAGNALVGDSWSYEFVELIEFVSVPAGTFTMGRSNVGDDASFGQASELPNHQVTLSAYDIGRYPVTNAEFATVMNWALAQGYLAGNTDGDAYDGEGLVYLLAPDSSSTRQPLFDTVTGISSSQIEWTGSAFAPRTRNSQSMADHPMVRVSWYGSVAFCIFLAEMEGKPMAYDLFTWELIDADPGEPGLQYVASYRLPTESEWERAAAWSLDYTTRFIYGTSSDTIDESRATFDSNNPMGLSASPFTTPVGWYDGVNISPNGDILTEDSPSPVGAYDMAGSVWEWSHDWIGGYTANAKTDPTGPSSGSSRVFRGGGWNSNAQICRSARRNNFTPSSWNFNIGIRVLAVRDHVPLTLTAPVDQNEPTNEATQTITLTFGEDVTGFDETGINVNNGTLSNFTTVSPDVYTVDVTAEEQGTVGIVVLTGAATGTSGRATAAAGFGWVFDTTAPTVVSTNPADQAIITSLDEIVVIFTEEVINLTAGQLTVEGSPATTVTGSNPYTFSGFTEPGGGLITVALAGGSTTDAAGNAFAGDLWSYDAESTSLTLTSTLAEDSISETQNQTLTFTFGDDVTGFDADTVSVTNATKGTFSGSGSVYTLELTGEGGLIEVNVPANFGPTFTDAATYSNFYQDTWAVELQESPLVTMDLIRIPAGTFIMGSPQDELARNSNETQHEVTLSQDFYLGKTQVTQAQWLAIQAFPQAQDFPGGNMPVHRVSYNDIQSWLSDLNTAMTEPGTFALPTESQWEYAARAGTTTRFNFGDGLHPTNDEDCGTTTERTDNMWYCGNAGGSTQLVGQKPANAWGLHDMHGNVWEWCADWFGTYPTGPVTDPTGPASGTNPVLRGGGWLYDARSCRSAQRIGNTPSGRASFIGFRALAVRPMPLTITSNETEPVHQTATQTLAFTFDSAVSNFDVDDITLTGAAKGTFTAISPTEYTLEITGTGGMIAASVLKSPATAAVSFSNFYQDTWTVELQESPLVTMDLIRIPAGTFIMGSPVTELSRHSLEVQHEVTLSQDFYLGKTQVTQNQWEAIQGFPQAQDFPGGNSPVHRVSHNDIQSWLADLNTAMTEPGTVGFPTESQWEYACRAGTTTRFSFGDGLHPTDNETCGTTPDRDDNMWYCDNAGGSTHPVGLKPANAWGLHDMHGNVYEWCFDGYGHYPAGPLTDPTGNESASARAIRGGGYNSTVSQIRSASRAGHMPTDRLSNIGFRAAAMR
ncbi:MAG: SUMF1/EgtB/PvdO family nonheme iron enzyme [Candidatus Sumerlaeia bacterium]|nr:SUMF1/EgtB/PvdO family nonheme iron enzyme [Candidatus Sumerlaeia bacterium]